MPDGTPPAPGGAPTPDAGAPPADDTPLGEAGEKALSAWKERAKAAEARAKQADAFEAELAELRKASQTEAERAVEEARTAGRSEAEAEIGARLRSASLELAVLRSAGSRFADPADALQFLSPADLVGADGEVDARALGAAVDALLEAKPYLAAGSPPPRVPRGPRDSEPPPVDMNARIRRAAGRG